MLVFAALRFLLQRRDASARRLCFSLSLLWLVEITATPALAGHGFMTAFGNIEWLPEPGRTPDSTLYKLDAAQEEGKLLLARDPGAKAQLCLTFAREKLAELEAMVKADQSAAAQTAVERYMHYLERAKQLVTEITAAAAKEAVVEAMTNALLEQQYILSVIYPDLPAAKRQVVLTTAHMAGRQYQDIVKFLPAKKKGALFFKEEEVRWSLQMAERADEEGEEGQDQ
jgi:hypothetical protein